MTMMVTYNSKYEDEPSPVTEMKSKEPKTSTFSNRRRFRDSDITESKLVNSMMTMTIG